MTFAEIHNTIFLFLYQVTSLSPTLNWLIYIIAEKIDLYVVVAGVIFIVVHQHGHQLHHPVVLSRISIKEGIYTSLGVGLAWIISAIMKASFQVARPYLALQDVVPLFPYGGYDSFPSGHATLFAALAVAIYLHHRRVGAVFIFLAFLIGTARVVAGVHYPLDVLAGWLLGALCSWLVYYFLTKRMK